VRYLNFEKSSNSEKLIQFIILAGCISAILIGAWLKPDPSGLGTHTALGFPPCGFYTITGIPCPTCGVTTSFAHAAHLQLKESFLVQPVGFLAFISVCLGGLAVTGALVTGKSLFKLKLKVNGYKIALLIVAVALLSWCYKIITVLKR